MEEIIGKTSTIDISKRLNMNHKSIFRLVNNYLDELSMLGNIEKDRFVRKVTGGRPVICYNLNKSQEVFLIMLTRNNIHTVNAKLGICKDVINV